MSAFSAMMAGREAAEALMTDELVVYEVSSVVDPLTGEDQASDTKVYEGIGQIQSYEPYASTAETGGRTATTQQLMAKFPVGSFTPEVGQVVECRASVADPNLVGLRLRVTSTAPFKTYATAYRVFVEMDTEAS